MPDKDGRPQILSTRILDPKLVEKLEKAGIALLQHDFIKVTHKYNSDTFRQFLNNPDSQARIFTSKNSVFSLQKLLKTESLNIESKKNFTVGIKATEMLADLGVETNARAGNAISLAQIIARNKEIKTVDFFCGNQSLDDLPEYLESKGIKVHKEIVYHTELVDQNLETEGIDGVIFLSPTAVYSFFKKNLIDKGIPCFCIGETTSEAIHLRCNNQRFPSREPSIDSVVDRVIAHFSVSKISH